MIVMTAPMTSMRITTTLTNIPLFSGAISNDNSRASPIDK